MSSGKSRPARGVFVAVARRLASMERLPNWLSRALGVAVLLLVSGLFINGGAILAANFMHVMINKVDMPPSLVYTAPSVTAPLRGAPFPSKATDGNPQSAPAYVTVPRPTLANAMDKELIRLHNPADAYIQSDAVDAGVLLEQSLHQALMSVFSSATRTPSSADTPPPGIPLTQGQ